MKIIEILTELSDKPHKAVNFNIADIKNRRFMFNAKTKTMLLGDANGAGKGKGISSSHAQEYYEICGTNAGFDTYIRGWVGTGGKYRNGIIHFAPNIPDPRPENWEYYDSGWKCLEYFRKNGGATSKTMVLGWGNTMKEYSLGEILNP